MTGCKVDTVEKKNVPVVDVPAACYRNECAAVAGGRRDSVGPRAAFRDGTT